MLTKRGPIVDSTRPNYHLKFNKNQSRHNPFCRLLKLIRESRLCAGAANLVPESRGSEAIKIIEIIDTIENIETNDDTEGTRPLLHLTYQARRQTIGVIVEIEIINPTFVTEDGITADSNL